MQEKILLADIAVNTQDPDFFGLSIDQRFEHLKNILGKMQNKLSSAEYKSTTQQKIRGILTAPEYFFAQSTEEFAKKQKSDGKKVTPRQFSEEEAITIQKRLAALSSRNEFRGILIIPGTVAWRQRAIMSVKKDQADSYAINRSLVASVPEHKEDRSNPSVLNNHKKEMKSRGVILSEAELCDWAKESPDSLWLEAVDILVTQKVFSGHHRKGAPDNSNQAKLDRIKKGLEKITDGQQYVSFIENGSDILISRNTAYFYLNGIQEYAYDKRSDYQEEIDFGPNAYLHGKKPPIVKIDNITFGIEICLDHNCGILSNFIKENIQHPTKFNALYRENVDIHLVLSAAVKNEPKFYCMKKDGYFIHSSSGVNRAILHHQDVQKRILLESFPYKITLPKIYSPSSISSSSSVTSATSKPNRIVSSNSNTSVPNVTSATSKPNRIVSSNSNTSVPNVTSATSKPNRIVSSSSNTPVPSDSVVRFYPTSPHDLPKKEKEHAKNKKEPEKEEDCCVVM
jgi:hypothetical protein